jgi:hypothetical protein
MDNSVNFNALMAWTAFGAQDYRSLEEHGKYIYNYFVHNPNEILKLDTPLLIGKIFQVCLGFQEPDNDIQEVRAENAFICFSQAIKSDKPNVHDEALARLMILLIRDQKYLIDKVEQACRNKNINPYNPLSFLSDGLPSDMPMATNTKMLFTAYYLYNCINNKDNVSNEFVNILEKNAYEKVKEHIIDNCNQLDDTSHERKRFIELGRIVFEKICNKLKDDIEMYSQYLQKY